MNDGHINASMDIDNASLDVTFGEVYEIDKGMPAAIIANLYSSQSTYSPGDYVIYRNRLYKCLVAIETPEEFDSTKWELVKVAEELKEKADKSTTYTKIETNALLDEKADATSVYTKTETDALLDEKANSDNVYTKAESDTLLDEKADRQSTLAALSTLSAAIDTKADAAGTTAALALKADKTYVDTELGKKANTSYVDTELDKKADKSSTYTKTEVDTALASKAAADSVYTKLETDEKISNATAAIDANFALEFNPDWTYEGGEFCIYEGRFKRCVNGYNEPKPFDEHDWVDVEVGQLIWGTEATISDGLNGKMNKTNPTGTGSLSLNRKANTTIGEQSVAIGYNSTASGEQSIAGGYNSTASNTISVALGNAANASGFAATAFGTSTKATGNYSQAEGYQTRAGGGSSHAEGNQSYASGGVSHAEGYSTQAQGQYSHAEGNTSVASGSTSHAEGHGTTASGDYSHAEGRETVANHKSQHVFGEYNVEDNSENEQSERGNYVEIVGNGYWDSEEEEVVQSNARTLDWSGNEVLAGDLTYNGNKSLTSEVQRLDGRIDTKANSSEVYTKSQTDNLLNNKANTSSVYTKTEVNTRLNAKANINDVYTKVQAESRLSTKANTGDVYTKSEVDNKLVDKADVSDLPDMTQYYDKTEVDTALDTKADKETTYTKSEVDDIVYNVLPDDTASGPVATFETDLALPIKSLEADVNAVQDLNGQSAPYPSGGSAQIWDEELESGSIDNDTGGNTSYYPNRARSKNYIPTTPQTAYYFVSKNSVPVQVLGYDENKNYIGIVKSMATSQNFTTLANCYFIRFKTTADYTMPYKNDFSINYPSTDTDYHPYSNICPIEGWSEIDIPKTGKNLANIAVSSSIHWGTDTSDLVQLLNTLPVGYYTVSNKYRVDEIPSSGKVLHGAFLIRALVNGEQINVTPYLLVTDNNPAVGKVYQESVSFEITEAIKGNINHAYRYCDQDNPHSGSGRGAYTCYDIQLELGSTATEYEPYNGTTEVINLGGTYYGGHFTQDKAGHRRLVVTHKRLELSTLTDWSRITNYTNPFFRATLPEDCKVRTASNNPQIAICDSYAWYSSNQNYWQYIGNGEFVTAGFGVSSVNRVYIRNDDYTDKNTFVSSLSGVYIVYELATPIIIDLPDGEPIITLNGTNNIYADTGDTSVVFKDSVNGYVEKKIASVQALTLNT